MRYVSRILLALLASTLASAAFAADNSVILTPGSGVTMRSKDVGLGVEAMMPILADTSGNPLATAPGTSNTVFALPIQGVTGGIAVPISGTVTANAGTNLNTSALATSANQATNGATTAHTCSTGGFSELGCLGQIDDDVKSSIAAGTNVIGFTSNDPCSQATKLGAPISLTASGQVITGTASKKTYICSIDLISATAQNIALVEGTGTTCATNIFGLAGGTTAATGWNLAANGGLTKGSGAGTVYSPSGDANATAANVCLLLSSTGQTSGQITYVQQ